MTTEQGGRGSIKQRDASVFTVSGMTKEISDEIARVDQELAKGLTIIEAYDYKFGEGCYYRDLHTLDKHGIQSHKLYMGSISQVYFPVAEAVERARVEYEFLNTLKDRIESNS